MREGRASIEALVAAEHATWADPVVDRSLFGTTDPAAIAEAFAGFCASSLGAKPARARFYRVSVGAVLGVELDDGREVVLKAQRGGRSEAYLLACRAVMRSLVARGFPCPEPIGEPVRAGNAWFMAEALLERGAHGDPHDAAIRGAIAASLAEMVRLARPFVVDPAFGGAWFTSLPDGQTFPKPHSPLFDFDRERAGAAWIESLAEEARARRTEAGERVVGHFDWRVEHLRFDGARVVASFDWDSLHAEREPVLVGAAAHAFTVDWQRDDLVRVPSRDEIIAFVADYETARGTAFDARERATAFASCLYSMCYTARCNHAANPRERGDNGDYRPALEAWGASLLD